MREKGSIHDIVGFFSLGTIPRNVFMKISMKVLPTVIISHVPVIT